MRSVIIVGAGASGLCAAIAAARGGAQTTVLEAQERPGRKLLVTGNGRCNLTNRFPELSGSYYGTGAQLARQIIRQKNAEWTVRFFRELGLLTQERDGYVYPYSAQASSVLEVLLLELRRLGVRLRFHCRVRRITDRFQDRDISGDAEDRTAAEPAAREFRYAVQTDTWTYEADRVILACGSCAYPAAGSSGDGYALARALGHTVRKPRPALTGLICRAGFLEQAAGTRCRASVTLLCEENGDKTHFPKGAVPGNGGRPEQTGQAGAAFPDSGNTDRECIPKGRPLPGDGGMPEKEIREKSGDSRRIPELAGKKQNRPGQTRILASETGELQWTRYGVSGIVIFQLSRFVLPEKGRSFRLSIDLLPDYEASETMSLLAGRAAALKKEPAAALLKGLLNDRLIRPVLDFAQTLFLSEAGCEGKLFLPESGKKSLPERSGRNAGFPKTCTGLTQAHIAALVRTMKDFRLPVGGVCPFEQAQICAGGVDCRELTEHLESRLHSGLYICGELADVDGPCGGYNLQWAFAGGYEAGCAAAGRKACPTAQ